MTAIQMWLIVAGYVFGNKYYRWKNVGIETTHHDGNDGVVQIAPAARKMCVCVRGGKKHLPGNNNNNNNEITAVMVHEIDDGMWLIVAG